MTKNKSFFKWLRRPFTGPVGPIGPAGDSCDCDCKDLLERIEALEKKDILRGPVNPIALNLSKPTNKES